MSGSAPFKVDLSSLTAAAIRREMALAELEGFDDEFCEALTTIYQRLRTEPLVFGEPVSTVDMVGLSVRHKMIRRVAIDSRVVPDRRVVLVRRVLYLSPAP